MKNNFEIIESALNLMGELKPNLLFIAADVTKEYLLFFHCEYGEIEHIEDELKKLGITYVGKYECLGIERFHLWDNTFGN